MTAIQAEVVLNGGLWSTTQSSFSPEQLKREGDEAQQALFKAHDAMRADLLGKEDRFFEHTDVVKREKLPPDPPRRLFCRGGGVFDGASRAVGNNSCSLKSGCWVLPGAAAGIFGRRVTPSACSAAGVFRARCPGVRAESARRQALEETWGMLAFLEGSPGSLAFPGGS